MNKFNKNIIVFSAIFIITIFLNFDLMAQCPMCKMSAESNMKAGGSAGKGLNAGILYLFALPYLTLGIIAYLWRKNRNKSYDS